MQIELLEIDFNSEEAIYMQLRNQIILGIATSRLQDGDTWILFLQKRKPEPEFPADFWNSRSANFLRFFLQTL